MSTMSMNTMDKTIKPSRTLFISELPAGMQEADLFALFQKCEGFTTARVRTDRNNRLVGFVDFESAEVAVEAKEKYNGYHVSPDDERSILTIQFAHNSTRPKKATDSPIEHRSDEHQAVLAATRNPINAAVTPAMLNNNTAATPAVNGNVAKPPRNTSYKDNVPKNFDAHPLATWNQYNQNLPTEASSTLYVEGLPIDATEREMSHIFRPFPGFQSLRIISKTMRGKVFNLCFVEFDNKAQATSAMNILQGYRMDINDVRGLKMSYAKTERRDRRVTSPRQGVNMSPMPMMSPDGSQMTAVGVPVTAQGPPTGLAAPNGMSVPGHALPAMNVAPQPQHHPHHHPVTVAAQPGNPPPYVPHPAAAGLPPNHMALHHQQRNFKLPPQPRK